MPLKDLPTGAQPREKLLARGASALSNAELLAILLRTGLAGQGVLALAQSLLELSSVGRLTGKTVGVFGGLAGLLQASASDLTRVKGLGPAKRAEILAVMERARRSLAQQLSERDALTSPQAVQTYLQAHFGHKKHEVFAVLFLDSQLRLIVLEELFRGALTHTVYPREVALRALHWHAHAVVLTHNHPSGELQPSSADQQITQRLKVALALLDVQVLDHSIVTQGQSLSIAERGLV